MDTTEDCPPLGQVEEPGGGATRKAQAEHPTGGFPTIHLHSTGPLHPQMRKPAPARGEGVVSQIQTPPQGQ